MVSAVFHSPLEQARADMAAGPAAHTVATPRSATATHRPATAAAPTRSIRSALQEALQSIFMKLLPPIVDGLGYATINDNAFVLVTEKGRVAAPQGGDWREVIVGGLPTGDSFPVATNGHLCNLQGKIQTWKRRRTTPEYDMVVMATTAHHREIVERTARTILRIKGRVCRVSTQLQTQASATHIRLYPVTVPGEEAAKAAPVDIIGPQATSQFDALLAAQRDLQQQAKNDPAWSKQR